MQQLALRLDVEHLAAYHLTRPISIPKCHRDGSRAEHRARLRVVGRARAPGTFERQPIGRKPEIAWAEPVAVVAHSLPGRTHRQRARRATRAHRARRTSGRCTLCRSHSPIPPSRSPRRFRRRRAASRRRRIPSHFSARRPGKRSEQRAREHGKPQAPLTNQIQSRHASSPRALRSRARKPILARSYCQIHPYFTHAIIQINWIIEIVGGSEVKGALLVLRDPRQPSSSRPSLQPRLPDPAQKSPP
jgi:hypothetical protein